MRVKTIQSVFGLLAFFKNGLWYIVRKNSESLVNNDSLECIAIVDFDDSLKHLAITYISHEMQCFDMLVGYATDEEKKPINDFLVKKISIIGYVEKRILEKMIYEAWYSGDKKQYDKNEHLRHEVRDLLLKMSSTEITVIPYILTTLKAIESLNLIKDNSKKDSYNNTVAMLTIEQLFGMISDIIYGVDNLNNLTNLLQNEFEEQVKFNLSKVYPDYDEVQKAKALRWLASF